MYKIGDGWDFKKKFIEKTDIVTDKRILNATTS